ncbi:hypothetical protein TRFO_42607 [Tritrichomonas foetus]|uniref:Atg6 BARA domain-containing protein n=1 Tax=Tritrichomonas foetus TaxID=1144522 RepID=A0A1J4KWL4_9EUKA|nr:hypothetical protein TRFO_42607 [Tritrichomonas foetus]|eukprot:OHT15272.1 hypothetical protein TRFO_42607 [Tritrichomonas foetus]
MQFHKIHSSSTSKLASMKPQIIAKCTRCGKLIVFQNDVFMKSKVFSNETLPQIIPYSIKKNVNIYLHCGQVVTQYTKRFNLVRNLLTFNNNKYFPLCQDCTTALNSQIRMYTTLVRNATDEYANKYGKIPVRKFKNTFNMTMAKAKDNKAISIQNNNDNQKKNRTDDETKPITALSTLSTSLYNDDEILEAHVKKMPLPSDFCLDPISCQNKRHQILPILMNIQNRTKESVFCPLLSCYAFKIGFDNHYGTINDVRIGFFKYSPNSVIENNAAFFFICHLIYHFRNAFNIPQIRVKLYPRPAIAIGDQSKFLNVEFPEKKKKSAINEFNQALTMIFQAFSLINEITSGFKQYSMPPFLVDNESKTIGDIPYLYRSRNVEEWSIAMRFLLVDLKMIQYRSIRSSFHH